MLMPTMDGKNIRGRGRDEEEEQDVENVVKAGSASGFFPLLSEM